MPKHTTTVIAITALVVAVFGSTPIGEAAWNQIVPRNSVGTLQLQRNAVKPSKLAPNAVRTGHVLNGSLLAADFRDGQIPQGPKGDKGDRGDRGATGPVGISGYEIVRVSTTVPANGSARAQAGCPSGKRVIGGAGNVQLLPSGVFVFTNLTGQQFYDVFATDTTASAQQVNAVAICANVSG